LDGGGIFSGVMADLGLGREERKDISSTQLQNYTTLYSMELANWQIGSNMRVQFVGVYYRMIRMTA